MEFDLDGFVFLFFLLDGAAEDAVVVVIGNCGWGGDGVVIVVVGTGFAAPAVGAPPCFSLDVLR